MFFSFWLLHSVQILTFFIFSILCLLHIQGKSHRSIWTHEFRRKIMTGDVGVAVVPGLLCFFFFFFFPSDSLLILPLICSASQADSSLGYVSPWAHGRHGWEIGKCKRGQSSVFPSPLALNNIASGGWTPFVTPTPTPQAGCGSRQAVPASDSW